MRPVGALGFGGLEIDAFEIDAFERGALALLTAVGAAGADVPPAVAQPLSVSPVTASTKIG